MDFDLHRNVLDRITADYGLKATGGDWLRKGTCPACGKKELYTRADTPWVLKCGRESKCGDSWHVKDLYRDLFEDWSRRAPVTPERPHAAADAYLAYNRGFDLTLIGGWYTQESYVEHGTGESSATVRFQLESGGWWERVIDRPHRFDRKARFQPGHSFKGRWWCPPSVDLAKAKELWIVEGIFDAIALAHHGVAAVSAMSCNVFPADSLADLKKLRGDKLPTLVWALDNEDGKRREQGARAYTRRWARDAAKLGFRCEAAGLPRNSGKDWNDYHQRWLSLADADRAIAVRDDLQQARYEGDLLLATSAEEKALVMYGKNPRPEFYFSFANRLYWFKYDHKEFSRAMNDLLDSDDPKVLMLSEVQKRNEALRRSGGVAELANCYPEFLYYQRNAVTDEAWYYCRIDFPHDGGTVKGTFTGAQVAAASEFKKRLIHMAPGAVWTGSQGQLDRIAKDQLFNIKSVDTIDFVGYSKEYQAYVFGDVAVRDGQLVRVNSEDFFEFGRVRLKTLQKSVHIDIQQDPSRYSTRWQDWMWDAFGAQGVVATAWWMGSIFCEQIRAQHKSYPFLEITGEAGAGKTTLLNFLWKLLGREHEGFDPSKSTKAGRRRHMGQVSGMPVVLIEADRNEPDRAHAKGFDFDELKDFYNGGTLGTTGMKTGGNETYEPPFRGAICISQNAAVDGSEAILTRLIKLHFKRGEPSEASRFAAQNLEMLQLEELSHFLLLAVKHEAAILATYNQVIKEYEAELRKIKELRVERVIKNHSHLMALVYALAVHLWPMDAYRIKQVHMELMQMALDRQRAISADHPAVAEFWEVFDYLENMDDDSSVNHSADSGLIAINLNEIYEKAAMHRQNLIEIRTLRSLLKDSRTHKFIEANRTVRSAIRSRKAEHNALYDKPETVRCWIFNKGRT